MLSAENHMTVTLMYVVSLFAIGLLVGSFLNVVIYRLPAGLSLVDPPSACPKCGARIAARDNIPVLGWLLLGGKCRKCRCPISWRYPGVELLAGLLWGAEGWRLANQGYPPVTGAALGLVELLFISALVAVAFIDCDHRIIPDEISLGGLAAGLAVAPFLPEMHFADSPERYFIHSRELYALFGPSAPWLKSLAASLAGGLAGAGLILFLYFTGNILFRKQIERAKREDPEIDSAIGLGDVKLLAMIGAFLGWRAAVADFLLACVLGALAGSALRIGSGTSEPGAGLAAAVRRRWETGNAVMPFGPFLAAAAVILLFFGTPLLSALSGLVRR